MCDNGAPEVKDPETSELEKRKTRKDIEKIDWDIANGKRLARLERTKTVAAILAPLVTAATIAGSVFIGVRQITAKSDSDEDERWRQTIVFVSASKPGDSASPFVATLLKPFFESNRYHKAAVGVTLAELPKLRDAGTFEDLFSSAFPKPDHSDLPVIANLARSLTTVSQGLYTREHTEKDKTADAIRENSVLEDERNTVIAMIGTLCNPISNILRNTDHKILLQDFAPRQRPGIPLDNIYFEKCDFSGIDLSDVDLTFSQFDQVKLDNADLKNQTDDSNYMWATVVWWKAKSIDGRVLPTVINQFKPYGPGVDSEYRDAVKIEVADWKSDVKRLCKAAHVPCDDEQLNFSRPNQ